MPKKETLLAVTRLNRDTASEWLSRQLFLPRFLNAGRAGAATTKSIMFESVPHLWDAVNQSGLPFLSDVTLRSITLTEWVPMAPGLSSLEHYGPDETDFTPVRFEAVTKDWFTAVYKPDDKARFILDPPRKYSRWVVKSSEPL